MIRLHEEFEKNRTKYQDPFYEFLCDYCEEILYILPIRVYSIPMIKNVARNFNLCRQCYQQKTEEELKNIARMSSSMVIDDLQKIGKHSHLLETEGIKKEKNDPYLEDLIKYLELKQLIC